MAISYSLSDLSPDTLQAARQRIADIVVRTPLIRLHTEEAPGELYLKLENLQPIGSFKLRGAANAILSAPPETLERGVWTASAGNMAQGVAWVAKQLNLECTVVVPDNAPQTKVAAIKRLGAGVIPVPYLEWLEVYRTHQHPGLNGLFIHAFSDPAVMAGNGALALEVLEDLPDVNAVITPYGGGGLSCGVAAAFRHFKPDTQLYAAEVETAAPFAASLAAGESVRINHQPSFVDGIGAPFVFDEMWEFARGLLNGSIVVSLEQTTQAIRLLAGRIRVIAEGAGAAPVAAALSGKAGSGKIVCVVSGGNIDSEKLVKILGGGIP